ncbi:E3 ubiquitin-protein ligase rnf8-like [Armigeres subalbatus]|uniref:E3 ubiquitin-protein ligase rnf8-like n=1 Tax=Armigeres subalbatus TaxID=124917 RepID=UPI002ED59600
MSVIETDVLCCSESPIFVSCCRYNLRNRGSTTFTVLTEPECPICLTELFDKPVIVNCGHTFCEKCIRETMVKYKNCPLCNQVLIASLFLSDKRFTQQLINKKQTESLIQINSQIGKNVGNKCLESVKSQRKSSTISKKSPYLT